MKALLFVAIAALLALPAAAAPSATLRLADLRKQVSVSDPKISADGSRVLILVSRRDFEKDKTVVDLAVVDVASKAERTLVRDGRVRVARWSPDGRNVAYVATPRTGDESPQLFVLPMNGGEPLQLTHEKGGVGDFAWRPDGRKILYAATPAAPNAKAIEAHDDAFTVTDDAWTAQSAPVPAQLFEISEGGGTARRILNWHWDVAGGLNYSADGRSAFVTRVKPNAHPNRYLASEIVKVSLEGSEVSTIPTLSATQGDPIRSFDGRTIGYAFANPRGTIQTEAAIANAGGAHPRFVTARLDRDVSIDGFAPGGALVLTANDGTRRRIFRVEENGAVSTYRDR